MSLRASQGWFWTFIISLLCASFYAGFVTATGQLLKARAVSASSASGLAELSTEIRIKSFGRNKEMYHEVTTSNPWVVSNLSSLFSGYRSELVPSPESLRSDLLPRSEGDCYLVEISPNARGNKGQIVVWSKDDVEYWSASNEEHQVRGRFSLLRDWLRVRRALELDCEITAEERADYAQVLINNLGQQESVHLRRDAVSDLLKLAIKGVPQPWLLKPESSRFLHVQRFACGPSKFEAQTLRELNGLKLEELLDDRLNSEVYQLSNLTADQQTIDRLVQKLRKATAPEESVWLECCLRACIGLPDDMCQFPTCDVGNTETQESQERAAREAQARFLAWYDHWATLDASARQDAIVAMWLDELMSLKLKQQGTPILKQLRLQNLLGRGTEFLPAIEAAQQRATDLSSRGSVEFVKAFWTGELNEQLVHELLAGDEHQQVIACDIIAATGSTSWKTQLNELLNSPKFAKSKLRWFPVAERAASALVLCHGRESLPLLTAARSVSRQTVQHAIQHLDAPLQPR